MKETSALRKTMSVLIALFGISLSVMTYVWASGAIQLEVNGETIDSDVAPEVTDGRVMVPIRWVAEALGADVHWEQSSRTVSIQANNDSGEGVHNSLGSEPGTSASPAERSLEQQVMLLEQALLSTVDTADELVERWAEAVKQRNGAAEFALLSDELKERLKSEYTQGGWVTGVSSPWVSEYAILETDAGVNNTKTFRVEFQMQTSTGPAGLHSATLTLEQRDGQWIIAELRGGPNGIPDLVPEDLGTDDEAVRDTIDKLAIGLTEAEIRERFGEPDAEVTASMNGERMWRYDVPAVEGYVFEGLFADDQELDAVDSDGLEQGKLRMQMFVTWSPDKEANGYSLYYKGEDGTIYHFHLMPDGKIQLK